MRLNLGAGRNPMDGYVNIDMADGPGIAYVMDLDTDTGLELLRTWCSETEPITEIVGIDFIEHITRPLQLMEALWDVAAPGCSCTFALPYGSSDDADEDPTHVRRYFKNSWMYFGQPAYYRCEPYFGYHGDWRVEALDLRLAKGRASSTSVAMMDRQLARERNFVTQQVVRLTAVKPARAAGTPETVPAQIRFVEAAR